MSFPYIFTFYSFKGGVGRSMAAVNVAYALASRGRNVLLLDMDLEAPGLSTFFHKSKEITEKSPLDVLDLLGWAHDWALAHPGDNPDFHAIANEGPNIGAYYVRVPPEKIPPPRLGQAGRLDLMLVDLERDYLQRFGDLHLPELSRDLLVRISRTLWGYFKSRRFPREVPEYYGLSAQPQDPYDYVLVDSRTGLTEIGALCIGPLADRLVVLTGLNIQNVEGTSQFLRTVGVTEARKPGAPAYDDADPSPSDPNTPPHLGPKPTLLVASPAPIGETDLKLARLRELLEKLDVERATSLTYHPMLAVRETVFVREYRAEYLTREYLALADNVMSMVKDTPQQLAAKSQKEWEEKRKAAAIDCVLRLSPHEPNLGVPLLAQLANVISPTTQEEFLAADRVYRILASEGLEARWAALNNWGKMLTDWAERTDDAGLKARRLAEAVMRLDSLLAANAAPIDVKAHGLVNRGVAYGKKGEPDRAIADYTGVTDDPAAPADQKAQAHFNRGVAYGKKGEPDRAIADYTAVIDDPAAPANQKANARVNRGVAKKDAGDTQGAIADAAAVLDMREAPAEQKATALVNRGVARDEAGDTPGAIADATAVLDMPDAPAEQKATALVNRGMAKSDAGDTQGAIADCNAVLDMSDAPTEPKARALHGRGLAKRQAGDTQGAIADYNAVLAMPDAPPEEKASASGNLGWARYSAGDIQGAVAASEEALALKPEMNWVQANLGLALLRLGRTDEGLGRYREAIGAITQPADLDKIVVADLGEAMKAVGNLPGAEAVLEMVERRKQELAAAR